MPHNALQLWLIPPLWLQSITSTVLGPEELHAEVRGRAGGCDTTDGIARTSFFINLGISGGKGSAEQRAEHCIQHCKSPCQASPEDAVGSHGSDSGSICPCIKEKSSS